MKHILNSIQAVIVGFALGGLFLGPVAHATGCGAYNTMGSEASPWPTGDPCRSRICVQVSNPSFHGAADPNCLTCEEAEASKRKIIAHTAVLAGAAFIPGMNLVFGPMAIVNGYLGARLGFAMSDAGC